MPERRKLPYWVRGPAIEAAFMALNEKGVTRLQVHEQLERWESGSMPDKAEWHRWAASCWAYFHAVAEMVKRREHPFREPPAAPTN